MGFLFFSSAMLTGFAGTAGKDLDVRYIKAFIKAATDEQFQETIPKQSQNNTPDVQILPHAAASPSAGVFLGGLIA